MLGCFFPTLLGRSQFDYFGIFYFPKSTFKVVPGETWVNEHTNFHMTLQLQSNQQMDDIQGVFFHGDFNIIDVATLHLKEVNECGLFQ